MEPRPVEYVLATLAALAVIGLYAFLILWLYGGMC